MISAIAAAVVLSAAPQGQERRTSLTGTIERHPDFVSKILPTKRNILVYLPPGYKESKDRYPVLYMGDGQNVFDGMTSYIPNKEWRMDETAEALIGSKLIAPVIIVAIDNAGIERANEYLPTRAKFQNNEFGGQADSFVKMLTDEIKPMIDKTYRTKPKATDTAIAGSSFGGIMALHAALTRPDVFGKAGVLSPSIWWDGRVMLKRVEALPKKPNVKIWMDIGTVEGRRDTDDMAAAMRKKGWTLGKDLAYFVDKDAQHNEEAWAHRAPAMLMFFFR